VLAAFHGEARERAEVMEGAPVTARLLESLVRLAEARARLELRDAITAQDAEVRALGGSDPPPPLLWRPPAACWPGVCPPAPGPLCPSLSQRCPSPCLPVLASLGVCGVCVGGLCGGCFWVQDAVDMVRECGVGSGAQDAATQGASHGARRGGPAGKSQKKEKQRFLKHIQKLSKQEPERLFDRQVEPRSPFQASMVTVRGVASSS